MYYLNEYNAIYYVYTYKVRHCSIYKYLTNFYQYFTIF